MRDWFRAHSTLYKRVPAMPRQVVIKLVVALLIGVIQLNFSRPSQADGPIGIANDARRPSLAMAVVNSLPMLAYVDQNNTNVKVVVCKPVAQPKDLPCSAGSSAITLLSDKQPDINDLIAMTTLNNLPIIAFT